MTGVQIIPSAASRAAALLHAIQFTHAPSCPCHHSSPWSQAPGNAHSTRRRVSLSPTKNEYAFEMASSTIRFGRGATSEVGHDMARLLQSLPSSPNVPTASVCVVTDSNVARLTVMDTVRASLERRNVPYSLFDRVQIEPKDHSILQAVEFARETRPAAFLAVGGGSVIDTAKMMNLHVAYPDAPITRFVPAPLGDGAPIEMALSPLVAVPTTAGTGSETTGTAIFDLSLGSGKSSVKTGVAHRSLRPVLGICDPLNTATMPSAVRASCGLDVLCHALESWTAVPFTERPGGAPSDPSLRPAYQGSNPISDIFAMHALRRVVEFLPRSVRDSGDGEAQDEMLLAATMAGVGFGNAGVHLCHAMSYPVSSMNPASYLHPGYGDHKNDSNSSVAVASGPGTPFTHQLIPHGVSVAVTSPAVFRFTAASNPDRHLAVAAALGADTSSSRRLAAGEILRDALLRFLQGLGDQPSGLGDLGFGSEHIRRLVEGTIPQRRVLVLAPGLDGRETWQDDGLERQKEQLASLFEDAMVYR